MMNEMSYGFNRITRTCSFSSPSRRKNLLCVTKAAVVSERASMLLIYTFIYSLLCTDM